jgi:hypothetical protein
MPALSRRPGRFIGALGAALALVGTAGCGAPKSKALTVTGKIVYKGTGESATRLSGGYVCLQSVTDPNNKPVGQIEDDGTFFLGTVVEGQNLGGVQPGEYRVRVVPPASGETGKLAAGVIDPRFMSFDKSGIKVTVAAGENTLTLEVERPRR